MSEPFVSVVIPVWRDEALLAAALDRLPPQPDTEVIVASTLGEDSFHQRIRQRYPHVLLAEAPRGRASQMNGGAAIARGRWLLFLHADSELPGGWLEVIREIDGRETIAAGAFRLRLDSRNWRARVIEAGVRLRVALFGLPYGDQALFVRNAVFTSIGGFRDLPLMEDVDFVRRVQRAGRLFVARADVRTSARRWERDGWMRRSLHNISLATRFLAGASPARLAQRYVGRKAAAIVMMARAPWTGGKTRVGVPGDERAHADLRHALFMDTLDVVTSVPNAEHIIACEPASGCERMRDLAGPAVDVIAQRGGHLGERMAHVFEDTFRLGAESVVVTGSDLPDLPVRLLEEAIGALSGGHDRIVLGPSTDGGYYLIGMNRLHPQLFESSEWSTDRVLARTVAAAEALGLPVVLLESWTDVDGASDLTRLLKEPNSSAARTRAWGATEGHRRTQTTADKDS
jgi:rSAM/selenodomain-associated transferase 2/rSAM/selenodomain-associated transferase 1